MKKVLDQQTRGTNYDSQREASQADPAWGDRHDENRQESSDDFEKGGHLDEGRNESSADKPRRSTLDPFDPTHLALGQDFAGALGVKKLTTHVPVRKPFKHEWIRVHR